MMKEVTREQFHEEVFTLDVILELVGEAYPWEQHLSTRYGRELVGVIKEERKHPYRKRYYMP